jgi:hypothetical protein
MVDGIERLEVVTPDDPLVVPWPRSPGPITSIFINSRNQPPPPVLASTVFPPPQWPLDGDDWTIMPVVGPIMALTEEQLETPPGFGGFWPIGASGVMWGQRDPNRRERRLQRAAGRREERMEERFERREERAEEREERRGRRRREREEERPAE